VGTGDDCEGTSGDREGTKDVRGGTSEGEGLRARTPYWDDLAVPVRTLGYGLSFATAICVWPAPTDTEMVLVSCCSAFTNFT